jgi:hypothetical protein
MIHRDKNYEDLRLIDIRSISYITSYSATGGTTMPSSIWRKMHTRHLLHAITLLGLITLHAWPQAAGNFSGDPNAHPLITKEDVLIVQRAQKILDSPAKWNRVDTRICPADAKTFSMYCALEKATVEVAGNFEHRGAAMQEARFVIDDIAPNRNYEHRLMNYNNDPTTTFPDIQRVFKLLEDRLVKRLSETPAPAKQK